MGADHHRLRGAHVADVALSPTANGHRLMAVLSRLTRHARAERVEDARERALCRGHPRLSFLAKDKGVDGRDKPGHDERVLISNITHPLLVTALVMAATWDAWRWYVQRVWQSPEEAASLAVTVAFLATLGIARRGKENVRLPLVPVALLLA